jgi:hypothetical protein
MKFKVNLIISYFNWSIRNLFRIQRKIVKIKSNANLRSLMNVCKQHFEIWKKINIFISILCCYIPFILSFNQNHNLVDSILFFLCHYFSRKQ